MPKDGGNLLLSGDAKYSLSNEDPRIENYLKKYAGSAEFINDIERYCLWIPDRDLPYAKEIPSINRILANVSKWRESRSEPGVKSFSKFPNRFRQNSFKDTDSIIVPRVSSERRDYVPIGYLGNETVISDAANAVYDAEPWIFSLLTSKMHVAWLAAVGGRMKTDYRYGAYIVYNNFPVPVLTKPMKQKLNDAAFKVLDVREYHCEMTLAELYAPEKMPADLRAAHQELDTLVDSIYSRTGYDSDEQRLADLFKLYEKMAAEEAAKAPVKKTRSTKK